MKEKLFLSAILLLSSFHISYSQCSPVPVKEAVRNGDFELGYLGGTVFTGNASPTNTHPATGTGGPMDFATDLKYGGMWSATGACKYSLSNQYGVGRVENPPCLNGSKALVYGQYASSGSNYKDHTKGTDQGYALIIDFDDPTDNAVGVWKRAWQQTVPVYGNQTYWFSAWFAQYAANSTPNMRFKVQWQDAGGANIGAAVIVGTAAPTQAWNYDQFKGSTVAPVNAAKAVVTIECDPTGIANSDDMIIDDISFINSCQNIATSTSYSVKFAKDSVNLCAEGGSYLAQVLKTTGGNLASGGTKTITWFKGATSPQTEITAWANQVNPSLTSADVYRVCVQDAAVNGCDVNATIVAYESVAYTPPNVTLCSPAQYTYDAGYTFPNNAMTIAWSGPSGAGSGQTYVANKAGSHTVTFTPAAGHPGCALTKNFTVTSNLPVAPTNLDYCDGGGSSTILTLGDGKPYKWSTSQTMSPLIGSGNSVSWTPAGGTTGDQTLWFQDASTSALGTVGPAGGFSGYTTATTSTFTTTKATVLSSFTVSAPGYTCPWPASTMSMTFTITGSANLTYTQTMNCGSTTSITPNFSLPAGSYSLNSAVAIEFATGGTTTVGGGAVTLTSTNQLGTNFTFLNSNACDPVPVIVKAKSCCTAPTDNPDLVTTTFSVCSPNKVTIDSKSGLTSTLDYKWQVSHDGGTIWTDTLAAGTVGATGKVSLTNIGAAGSYRLVVATAGNITKSCVKNSPAAVVTIKPLPASISISVAPNQTQFCKGEPQH